MSVVTSLLCRFQGGYRVVDDFPAQVLYGRKEGFLQLGQVTEADEVDRIGAAVLAFMAAPRVATTLGIEPEGIGTTDTPYVGYGVGDSIVAPDEGGSSSTQRVVSITVAEDDQGDATFANELKATFQVEEERLNVQLKKLLNGTLKGSSVAPQPLPTGSVTNASNGDSVGALRTFITGQLATIETNQTATDRSAHTSNISGIGTSGGTFDPGVDQPLTFEYSTVVSATLGGHTLITLPDSGFPTGLLAAWIQLGEPASPGGVAYFATIDTSASSKTQVQFLMVDATGAPYPAGSNNMRIMVRARGW